MFRAFCLVLFVCTSRVAEVAGFCRHAFFRCKGPSNPTCKAAPENILDSITSASLSIPSLTTSRSMQEEDYDYLGLINFCLRSSDTALSRTSRSKLLNTLTNDVFKAIMINNEYLVNTVLSRFDKFFEVIDITECVLDEGDGLLPTKEAVEIACTKDALTARIYVDWLEKLLLRGNTQDNVILGGIYDKGYKKLLTMLKNAGCSFKGNGVRPSPSDTNLCLSILDLRFPAPLPSRTVQLNSISNTVSRAMLYGGFNEKKLLVEYLLLFKSELSKKWTLPSYAQELQYIDALVMLLDRGVAVAADSLMSAPPSGVFGMSNVSGTIDELLPTAVVVAPKVQLFDTYLNAFQRVLENCLSEIGMRGNSVPQNDDVLNNFVLWEQSVRRNLTDSLWRPNPTELIGKWQLVDVRGEGSLGEVIRNQNSVYMGRTDVKVEIHFKENGVVDVGVDTGVGQGWRFKPGPAHLDTCEFIIQSSVDADLVLKYIGYIDRGQRIESRFSLSPIRMTGRVISTVKGDVRGSSRFIMVLTRGNRK